MHALGIIPARGGSKGVPRKNIRPVAGAPLLAYSIAAAVESTLLCDFVVSTDDDEIAAVARGLGVRVLRRPATLATDDTPMLPVVRHVLHELEAGAREFDVVVVLQPTAPLRLASDIDAALEILRDSNADSVISVYRVEDHHPARMYQILNGRLRPYASEPSNRLRQMLPPVYHRNGAIYASRRAVIELDEELIGADTRPYIMPRERSLNIDDEVDLALADLLLRRTNVDAVPGTP